MGQTPIPRVPPRRSLLDEAKDSYVDGRCTLDEFEDVVARLLAADFPIPVPLAFKVFPVTAASAWRAPPWWVTGLLSR